MFNIFILIVLIALYQHNCSSAKATTDGKSLKILPNNYSPQFDRDVIRKISSGVCRQEAHVIRFVVDDTIVPLTAQNILHEINTNCHSAPVEVMFNSIFRIRSEAQYPFDLCVFVFVLSDWTQFRSELFNRRLESKGLQRYFFVIEGVVLEQNTEWLYKMMAEIWQRRILNVVVIFSKGDEQLHWFTYTPFEMKGMQINLLEMNSTSDWFFNKLWDVGRSKFTVTMKNNEVRAIAKKNFETEGFTGVDGKIAELIGERMNAIFVYTNAREKFNGSKNSGTFGDIRSGRASFGFNSETYLREFHEDVIEASYSFERNDICILVPNGAPEPTLYNLMYTLTPLTWAIIIASNFLMVTAYRWMQSLQIRLLGIERHNYNILTTFSIHFQSFFGDSISSLPTSSSLRVLIVCWCVYSFLINTAFTAKLISSLVLPRHEADIDTLEDLGKSPLNIVHPDFVSKTLWQGLEDDKLLFDSLRDQMIPMSIDRLYALAKEDRESNAYVMANYAAKFLKKTNFDPTTSRSFYHIMQECLFYSPKVYPIEQGSAYLVRINELLGRFHEMGFIAKWERDTSHHRYTLDGKITMSDEELEDEDDPLADGEEPKVVITVAHLQAAFYLLFFGLMLSGIAFAGEHLWMNRERKKSLYRVVYFNKELARKHGCNVD